MKMEKEKHEVWEAFADFKGFYRCSRCLAKIDFAYYYCGNCGQKFKEIDNMHYAGLMSWLEEMRGEDPAIPLAIDLIKSQFRQIANLKSEIDDLKIEVETERGR